MGLFVLVGIMPFMVYVLKLHDATIMVRGLGGDSIDFFGPKNLPESVPQSVLSEVGLQLIHPYEEMKYFWKNPIESGCSRQY